MALMLGKLHEALLEAGASQEKAREAAEEAAAYETRLASIERKVDKLGGDIRLLMWANGVTWAALLVIIARLFTAPLA